VPFYLKWRNNSKTYRQSQLTLTPPKGRGFTRKNKLKANNNLTEEALHGLIEEFVTREGTDTGYTDGSLEENVEMVKRQLKRGDVLIVYDGDTQTANIVPKKNARIISHEEK